MSPLTLGVALLSAALVGGITSNRVTALYYKNQAAEAKAERDEAVAKANVNADAAAELYEEAKRKQRPRNITVTKEITVASATTDPCGQQPVSDGLRDAITRAANPDSGKPAGPVPGVPAERTYDLGQSGGGLGGSVRRLFGASGSTQ